MQQSKYLWMLSTRQREKKEIHGFYYHSTPSDSRGTHMLL